MRPNFRTKLLAAWRRQNACNTLAASTFLRYSGSRNIFSISLMITWGSIHQVGHSSSRHHTTHLPWLRILPQAAVTSFAFRSRYQTQPQNGNEDDASTYTRTATTAGPGWGYLCKVGFDKRERAACICQNLTDSRPGATTRHNAEIKPHRGRQTIAFGRRFRGFRRVWQSGGGFPVGLKLFPIVGDAHVRLQQT
jgi:hypothetical protein